MTLALVPSVGLIEKKVRKYLRVSYWPWDIGIASTAIAMVAREWLLEFGRDEAVKMLDQALCGNFLKLVPKTEGDPTVDDVRDAILSLTEDLRNVPNRIRSRSIGPHVEGS